jgi:hypothetical protein
MTLPYMVGLPADRLRAKAFGQKPWGQRPSPDPNRQQHRKEI